MSDKIVLENMKYFGHLGCTPEERSTPQLLIVDAELFLNLKISGESDNLDDTVNYVQIRNLIQNIIENTTKNLIESLAENIAQSVLKNFPLIDSIKLKIFKPLSDAAVQIERYR